VHAAVLAHLPHRLGRGVPVLEHADELAEGVLQERRVPRVGGSRVGRVGRVVGADAELLAAGLRDVVVAGDVPLGAEDRLLDGEQRGVHRAVTPPHPRVGGHAPGQVRERRDVLVAHDLALHGRGAGRGDRRGNRRRSHAGGAGGREGTRGRVHPGETRNGPATPVRACGAAGGRRCELWWCGAGARGRDRRQAMRLRAGGEERNRWRVKGLPCPPSINPRAVFVLPREAGPH
jgi:hypothetical protein